MSGKLDRLVRASRVLVGFGEMNEGPRETSLI